MMKISSYIAVFGVLVSALCGAAWAYDLSEKLNSGELWALQRNRNPEEDVYMLDADETRSYTSGTTSKIEFSSLTLGEVLFDWKEPQEDKADDKAEENADEKPAEDKADVPNKPDKKKTSEYKANVLYRVTAMVYTRGDNDSITMKEYKEKLKSTTDVISKALGKKGKSGFLSARKSGMKVDTVVWVCEHGVLRLESAILNTSDGKRPEFIRIVIATDRESLDRGGASDKVGKRDLKANVVTDDDGTIWIKDIPMIDQGDKGYCLPATVARVFAYYGMDGVGLHEIAALCNSSADGGTSVAAMKNTLREMGSRFHVRVKEFPRPSLEYFDAVPLYNREAKKNGKPELPDPRTLLGEDVDWRKNIDQKLWCKVRAKKAADVKKWMAPIRKSITAGVPVLWGVFASGMYTGSDASIGEAHMRMIIGFNPKTNTVIFSDSWGKGTAKRVMTMDQAYSVTDGTYVIQP